MTPHWLREYIGHLCYEWLNYYVRMRKDVVWAHHERFPLGFLRWWHSVGGAERAAATLKTS